MSWLIIAAIAIGAGFLYPIVSSKLTGFIPGFASGNAVGQAFFTGAFILVALMLTVFAIKIVVPRKRISVPGV